MKNSEIIKKLVLLEKKYSKFYFKSNFNFREHVTNRIFNQLIKNNQTFNKSINGLKIYFPNSSKIAKEFLLSHEKSPDHIWEPQTHKLLNILCKKKKYIFFGGAFFGDHACLIANKFSQSRIYCFEPLNKQRFFLQKNKKINNLNNLYISKKALFNIKDKKLFIKEKKKDDGDISLTAKKKNSKFFYTDTLDNFVLKRKIKEIDVLMIDVEGNELNVLLGAKNLIKNGNLNNIIFEIHSKYVNWRKGLKNTPIIKLLLKYNFNIYSVRDYHSNIKLKNKVELISLKNTYLDGPSHGFNLIATKDKKILTNKNIYITNRNYSPKYLFHKTSNKYHYI